MLYVRPIIRKIVSQGLIRRWTEHVNEEFFESYGEQENQQLYSKFGQIARSLVASF